jgi:hypothetical protein
MRLHPLKWTATAEDELFRHVNDPDEQDALIDAIDDALKNFPRSHPRDKRYGPRARKLRARAFTVIYDEPDPAEDEPEPEDESPVVRGGTVWVRHIWPERGARVREIRRNFLPTSRAQE